MSTYQIDDVTQLYYDAEKRNDSNQYEDPSNIYWAPTSINWTQRPAAVELQSKDDNRIQKEFGSPEFAKWSRVAMLFKHVLLKPSTDITKLSPEFQGYASEAGAREVRFYIWNFTLSQWDRIGTGSIDSLSDDDWTDEVTSGFTDYVDGSNVCYFMAYTYEGTNSVGTPRKGLYGDYWRLTVFGPSGRPFYLGVP